MMQLPPLSAPMKSRMLSPAAADGRVLAALIFGAILLGAGVLLFVAAHWDRLSPLVRHDAGAGDAGFFFHGLGILTRSRFRPVFCHRHAWSGHLVCRGSHCAGGPDLQHAGALAFGRHAVGAVRCVSAGLCCAMSFQQTLTPAARARRGSCLSGWIGRMITAAWIPTWRRVDCSRWRRIPHGFFFLRQAAGAQSPPSCLPPER